MLATSYPLLEVFWTMLIFFAFFIWIWLLITVFMDVFRRQDIGGWGKTGWIIFVIILPYLGVFVYLIAEHKGMTERAIQGQQEAKTQMDDYVRSVAGPSDPGQPDRQRQGTARQGRAHAVRVRRHQGRRRSPPLAASAAAARAPAVAPPAGDLRPPASARRPGPPPVAGPYG